MVENMKRKMHQLFPQIEKTIIQKIKKDIIVLK